jgi:hypothetical protein
MVADLMLMTVLVGSTGCAAWAAWPPKKSSSKDMALVTGP